jgi:hypothetical protein
MCFSSRYISCAASDVIDRLIWPDTLCLSSGRLHETFLAISDLSSGEVQDLLDLAMKLKEAYFKKVNQLLESFDRIIPSCYQDSTMCSAVRKARARIVNTGLNPPLVT